MSHLVFRAPLARVLAALALLSITTPSFAQTPNLGAIAKSKRENAQPSNAAESPSLRYTSDPARRKSNYAKAVAGAKTANPALAELYQGLSTQVDLYAIINDYLGKYGMRADDLGDVMALSWFSAYQVANGGKTDDPTKAQLTAIRAQLATASGGMAGLSNTDKQDLADAFMLDTAAQQTMLEAVKESSPDLLPKIAKNLAEVNSQTFNIDFAQMNLTSEGLVPKPGSAAVQPGKKPLAGLSAASSTAKKPAVSNKTSTPTGAIAKPAKAPADYSHLNQILGVRYESQLMFMAGGPAGYLNRTERTSVLFKDGTACWDCLSEFMEDPSLRKYRKDSPTNIGRWTKKGANYYVTYPDTDGEPWEIGPDQLLTPAPKGTRYNGTFETSGGMTMGGVDTYTTTSWSEDLRMYPDGRFSWAKDSGFVGGGNGVSFAGNNSKPSTSGKYYIDGYVIRFEFDNGHVETESFVYFPKENDIFIVGGYAYWIPSD